MHPDRKSGLRNDACLLFIALLFITVSLINLHRTVNLGKDFLVPKGTSFTEFVASNVEWRSLFYYIGRKIDETGLAIPTIYLPVDSKAYLRVIKIKGRYKRQPEKLKRRIKNYIAYATYPRRVMLKSYNWRISDRKKQQILKKYRKYCHRMGDHTIVILTKACKGKKACYMYFDHRFIVIGPINL